MSDETISDEEISLAFDWIKSLGRWPDDESPKEMILRMGVGRSGTDLAITAILAGFIVVFSDTWPPVTPAVYAREGRDNPDAHDAIRRHERAANTARAQMAHLRRGLPN